MTFGNFCLDLAKIEATAKRLEMTSLLAELLKQVNSSEVDKVVMLALGRLAPLYKDIDFGLAEKMIVRAIAAANGVSSQAVVGEYKKNGDLGETAAKFKVQSSKFKVAVKSSKLSVTEVFNRLTNLANESGEGSQERKVTKAADLLRELDPLGAKYAVRIILGNLRLGFSDKTVLDALSVMIAGDKSAREKLEAAYNVRPDVGWLAKQVLLLSSRKAEGLSGIYTNIPIDSGSSPLRGLSGMTVISPQLGIPIMPALCQRLPAAEEIVKKMREVAVEPKWDGQRIQAHIGLNSKSKIKNQKSKTAEIHLFTRSLEDVTEMFPDLVDALSVIPAPCLPAGRKAGIYRNNLNRFRLIGRNDKDITSLIFDGEVVAIDPGTGRPLPFQTMITRKRKYGIQEKLADVPVRYMVFDVLYLNGKSLMSEEFTSRRQTLERTVLGVRQGQSSSDSIIQLAPQLTTSNPAEIRKFLKQQIDNGLEGIVAKRSDAAYIPGRTQFAWVKLKWEGAAKSGGLLDTVDCVVMGTYGGRGKRSSFGVGAFLVGVLSDLSNLSDSRYLTISKIGTGLTDEQWRELKVKSEKLKVKSQPVEYDVPKGLMPDKWLRPELVVEIQADNITKSPLHSAGYALRFPRLVRYRADKRPQQVTTIEEIDGLYKMQ